MILIFFQISYIDDCDDVDDLMGTEWECHKEAWQSLWQLAECCVEHNRHKRPSSMKVSTQILHNTVGNEEFLWELVCSI